VLPLGELTLETKKRTVSVVLLRLSNFSPAQKASKPGLYRRWWKAVCSLRVPLSAHTLAERTNVADIMLDLM
jgi:hypothetical protein